MEKLVKNAQFYSPVRKVASSELNPNIGYMSYNEYKILVIDQETGKEMEVNSCSENYALIPTDKLFPQIEKELSKDFKFKGEYTVKNLAKFYIDYTILDQKFRVNTNDKIAPIIRIQHSYNSQIVYTIFFGVFSEKSNSYLYGIDLAPKSLSHSEGNIEEIVEGTIKETEKFLQVLPELIKDYEKLASRIVPPAAIIPRIEQIIKATKFHQIKEAILEELSAYLEPITDWCIYNAFACQLNHNEDILMQPEYKVKRDRDVFKYILQNQ